MTGLLAEWFERFELEAQNPLPMTAVITFCTGEYKEITDLRTLGWPIQINWTFLNILKSRIIIICNIFLYIGYRYIRLYFVQNFFTDPQAMHHGPHFENHWVRSLAMSSVRRTVTSPFLKRHRPRNSHGAGTKRIVACVRKWRFSVMSSMSHIFS